MEDKKPTTTEIAATPASHWAKDKQEEDRVETLIRGSGCWDEHIAVVDCMGDSADWRKCQEQLGAFRVCMTKAHQAKLEEQSKQKK